MHKVEFSLANGSALIRQLQKLGLFPRIPREVRYQIMLAVVVAWLPLLIFTAHDGLAIGTRVEVPFLFDLIQHARFLIALPCAIALGTLINPRLNTVLNSFLKSGIVVSKDFSRFEQAIARAKSLASSLIVEIVILALVYTYSSLGLHRKSAMGLSSWDYVSNGAAAFNTPADWWFFWVSLPMLIFAWFLWMWRLSVWAYLLFRISQLELRIVATHPDRAGGMNFVNVGMRRFSILVFAISSILCASIGEEILFKGASLTSYELELTLFFLLCVALILGPELVFTPSLVRSKLRYWGLYGPFASRYVQAFDEKWVLPGDTDVSALGTPDIQSLADLRHSYSGIAEMRTMLPNRTTIVIFAAAFVVPALPLLASVFSLRRILSEAFSLLFK